MTTQEKNTLSSPPLFTKDTPRLMPSKYFLVMLSFIAGLPLFSESVYTPTLIAMAKDLQTTIPMVEFTLSTYLGGFACGIFFWGNLSDRFGRKPCLLLGFCVYSVGCIGCYYAATIEMLLLWRAFQAFGCSVGSVLGQAVCRDMYRPPALGRAFAFVGAALSFAPAIGPIMGGYISLLLDWRHIFLVLTFLGLLLILSVSLWLPETLDAHKRSKVPFFKVLRRFLKDKQTLALGFIIGGAMGCCFSYFAEGPFYFITAQGLSPYKYGTTFLLYAGASFVGSWLVRRYHDRYTPIHAIKLGTCGIILASCCMLIGASLPDLSTSQLFATLMGISFLGLSAAIVIPSALGLALLEYPDCRGTAGAIFGLYYYIMIALWTFFMGVLHNDTLYMMPLYFIGISVVILCAARLYEQGSTSSPAASAA